jgi:hypothetical protein
MRLIRHSCRTCGELYVERSRKGRAVWWCCTQANCTAAGDTYQDLLMETGNHDADCSTWIPRPTAEDAMTPATGSEAGAGTNGRNDR